MSLKRNPLQILKGYPSSVEVRSLFSIEECKQVIDFATKNIQPDVGKVLNHLSPSELQKLRNSNVRWLRPSSQTDWIFSKLDHAIEQVNSEWFNFNLLGFEACQFTEYDSNELHHYNWHTDMAYYSNQFPNQSGNAELRKLSISISLNQQEFDFEGGNFEIDNPTDPVNIQLDVGDSVFFPSFVWHRVTPVTKGTRYSLVVWVLGKPFQ